MSRFEADRALRERAQTALARLKDPQGYDLWWLARRDAIEARPWYVVFPILAATTILLLILAPIFPQLIPALIGVLVTNVALRFLTMGRIGEFAAAFRQMEPVVTTADSLTFLGGDDVRPASRWCDSGGHAFTSRIESDRATSDHAKRDRTALDPWRLAGPDSACGGMCRDA